MSDLDACAKSEHVVSAALRSLTQACTCSRISSSSMAKTDGSGKDKAASGGSKGGHGSGGMVDVDGSSDGPPGANLPPATTEAIAELVAKKRRVTP